MPGRVAVPSVESSDEARRKGQRSLLQSMVGVSQSDGRLSLLLVEMDQPLECKRRNKESRCHPERVVAVAVHHQSNHRDVERHREREKWAGRAQERPWRGGSAEHQCRYVHDGVSNEVDSPCNCCGEDDPSEASMVGRRDHYGRASRQPARDGSSRCIDGPLKIRRPKNRQIRCGANKKGGQGPECDRREDKGEK